MEHRPEHPFRSTAAKAEFLARYDARAQQWPIPSETAIVETFYGSTFIRISGPEHGPPLVLLHGHSENALNWIPNIEALSQSYRTYAIDTISDPGRSVYTQPMKRAEDYTAWLEEVFASLNLQDICLIGLSFGGWLVSQYALQFPQRLRKIVLMAPAYTVFPLSKTFLLSGLVLMSGPILLGITRPQFLVKTLVRWYMQWMFKDLLKTGSEGREIFEEWFEFFYLGLCSHKSQSLVWATVLSDAELNQLNMPTLFLVGENEIIYAPQKVVARLQAVAPGIQTCVIANAGHDLPIAQPQQTNRAILDFLTSS